MGTSKSNLAKVNEKRDYRIYESFAAILVKQVQRLATAEINFELPIDAPVYAIDATVVDLCLNVFWWGKFRKHKAAVKINTMLDVKTNIPTFIYVTSGAIHEVKSLDHFPIESGSFYVMDKAYIDFGRLYAMHKSGAFFILRAKENFQFVRLSSRQVDKSTGLKCDQTIRLKNQKVALKYPESFRRVKYYDSDLEMESVL
jgi:hypothetical protein